MGSTFITAVTAASAVCAGVAGGVYFAFATIVVPALRALPAVEAVTAMQRLNISAVRLPFMVVFFGGAAASAAVIIAEVASGTATPAAVNRMAGAGFALASFGITIVRNVPLNNALSRLPLTGRTSKRNGLLLTMLGASQTMGADQPQLSRQSFSSIRWHWRHDQRAVGAWRQPPPGVRRHRRGVRILRPLFQDVVRAGCFQGAHPLPVRPPP